MTTPEFFKGPSITRFLQGTAVGAVGAMAVGFMWGGWVSADTASKMTSAAVESTQVSLYAPVCVDRYAATATPEQRATFAKAQSWSRDTVIEKAGFATPPGATAPIGAVADACATTLSSQLKAADKI